MADVWGAKILDVGLVGLGYGRKESKMGRLDGVLFSLELGGLC